jgi:hypothetical protein
VFDPVAANVATVDPDRAETEVQGVFGSGEALASAYSGELFLVRSVLTPPGSVERRLMAPSHQGREKEERNPGRLQTCPCVKNPKSVLTLNF